MLATPWRAPFSDPNWLFEPKWDGVRVVLGWDGSSVTARTRRGNDLLASFPELGAFRWPRPFVLDGEIVAVDSAGVPSFELLQQRMHVTGRRAHDLARSIPISVVAFDALHDDRPLLDRPLEERRARLARIEPGLVVVSESTAGYGEALFEVVKSAGMEGIVAKRLGSRYHSGVRSVDWRKIAVVHRLRAVVGGYLPGEGGRRGTFGSLLLGLFDGSALRCIGRVGSGFDDRALAAVRAALDQIPSDTCPFVSEDDGAAARWVIPALVVRVSFKNWTGAGRLRGPVFEGMDLAEPDEVTWAAEGPTPGE